MNPLYVFIPNCGAMNGERADEFVRLLAPSSAISGDAIVERLDEYDQVLSQVLKNQQVIMIVCECIMEHHEIKWPFAQSLQSMLSDNAKALLLTEDTSEPSACSEDEVEILRSSLDSFKSMSLSVSPSPKKSKAKLNSLAKSPRKAKSPHKANQNAGGDADDFAEFVWKCASYRDVEKAFFICICFCIVCFICICSVQIV